jgi:hypothetical protein
MSAFFQPARFWALLFRVTFQLHRREQKPTSFANRGGNPIAGQLEAIRTYCRVGASNSYSASLFANSSRTSSPNRRLAASLPRVGRVLGRSPTAREHLLQVITDSVAEECINMALRNAVKEIILLRQADHHIPRRFFQLEPLDLVSTVSHWWRPILSACREHLRSSSHCCPSSSQLYAVLERGPLGSHPLPTRVLCSQLL